VFQDALDADFARATRTGGIKALRPVSPSYSPQARRAGIQGSVEIEALVMPDGSVGAARVTKSLDRVFGLDEQALAAARQWVFSPPVDANGQPVRAVVTLILDFRHASTPDLVRAATEPAPQGEASATPAQAGDPNAASREPRYFRDYLDYVKGKEEVGARLQEASGVLRQGAAAHGAQDLAQSAKDLEFRRGAVSAHTVGLTPPKTLRTEQPRYTSSAMRSKIQGSVLVEAVVMPDGTVGRVRVTKSLDDDLGLDAEALAAARLWRFEPGRLNGQPVAVFVHLVMDFRLY
jgi:TonB family protein